MSEFEYDSSSSYSSDVDENDGFQNDKESELNHGITASAYPANLPAAPKLDVTVATKLKFDNPPSLEIAIPDWSECDLPMVSVPNDTAIEEMLNHKFDLSTLYNQMLSK